MTNTEKFRQYRVAHLALDYSNSTACCEIVAEDVRIDVTAKFVMSPDLPEIEHRKVARGLIHHILTQAAPFI
jgi:hypothetical protein